MAYKNPVSSALNAPVTFSGAAGGIAFALVATSAAPQTSPPPDMDAGDEDESKRSQVATQVLLDKFRADSLAGKRAGILLIRVPFPAFGPFVYLVSELTGENQAPSAGLRSSPPS